jgi:uncharacterized protein YPO0396
MIYSLLSSVAQQLIEKQVVLFSFFCVHLREQLNLRSFRVCCRMTEFFHAKDPTIAEF